MFLTKVGLIASFLLNFIFRLTHDCLKVALNIFYLKSKSSFKAQIKKSCIRETLTLSTDEDRSNNTIFFLQ